MNLHYSTSATINAPQFIDVLNRTSLGARRPIDNVARIESMLQHADILCTAWDADRLVGVARSITDYSFCCYLSDLAVDADYQRKGIGKQLIALTQSLLLPEVKLILLSAPEAVDYYPRIGFTLHPSAWFIPAGETAR